MAARHRVRYGLYRPDKAGLPMLPGFWGLFFAAGPYVTPLRTKVLRVVAVGATFFASFEFCAPAVKPVMPRDGSPTNPAQLWVEPRDIGSRDLFYGVWGQQ